MIPPSISLAITGVSGNQVVVVVFVTSLVIFILVWEFFFGEGYLGSLHSDTSNFTSIGNHLGIW